MTRVGVIGPLYPDSFADNVRDSLSAMGIEAVVLGTPRPETRFGKVNAAVAMAAQASDRFDQAIQGRVLNRALAAECDLVINVHEDLSPTVVRTLRGADVPVAMWFPDPAPRRGAMLVADYTRIYVKDRVLLMRTRSYGASAEYLPEACNPRWHKPTGGVPGDENHLVMIGSVYAARALLLQRLVDGQVPLRIYGRSIPGWLPTSAELRGTHAGRMLLREEKATAFRRAGAVLNNLHPAENDSGNARLFEATGSGGAVITEYRPPISEMFEVGTEVLTFETYEELVKHWRHLADDPAEAKILGDAASRRAHAEHTYEHRLSVILEDCLR